MKIVIHNINYIGDLSPYYLYVGKRLKRGHYYWVGNYKNIFKVILRIGNLVLSKKT